MANVLFGCCASLLLLAPAFAGNWVETVDGDLSDDNTMPTLLDFGVGPNTITGSMGTTPPKDFDPDFFTFTLEPGESINSIVVNSITGQDQSFFAIVDGTTIDLFSGGSHLSNFFIGGPGEYFQKMADPDFGAVGLQGPLGPGTYTVWFQETGLVRDYSMTYTVVVPEPCSTLALAAFPLLVRRSRCD